MGKSRHHAHALCLSYLHVRTYVHVLTLLRIVVFCGRLFHLYQYLITMVYFCEASECQAHSSKLKKISKYPWMIDIRWVKWPRKDAAAVLRWKNLIKREGKSRVHGKIVDQLTITKRSRLCSRHFDEEDIDMYGNAMCDPKYFEWNNWGGRKTTQRAQARTTLSLRALQKLDQARQAQKAWSGLDAYHPVDVGLGARCEVKTHNVPPVEGELAVTVSSETTRINVGRMEPLFWAEAPQPMDHDYLCTPSPALMIDQSVQTVMTMNDITALERQARSPPQPLPGQAVVDYATETDEKVKFYTGLTSKSILLGIFDSISDGVDRLQYWKRTSANTEEHGHEQSGKRRSSRRHQLPLFLQFLMTLIRLRLNLPLLLLADLFHVSRSTVATVTITWISYLHQTLVPALLVWPSQAYIRGRMPSAFKATFPNTRVVIDCSKFLIYKRRQTHCQYNSHSTCKVLFGVSPSGAFTFVSDLWSGNVSEKYLIEQSGLIDKLDDGDAVMANQSFHIEDSLRRKKVTLIVPPLAREQHCGKGKRLNVNEIGLSRQIARLRVRAERAIRHVKRWQILKHQIPQSLRDCAPMIVKLVAALCNVKAPLFNPNSGKCLRKQKVGRRKPVKRLKH
ncbi:uncharacterized protein LOC110981443 [Acanthaster planci]|uniref:Uncharacterized protein LOC110981443 n=1 Tax=Acanthaster planci TaxID=133434 RepID=A0A8B7YN70_ACAPL|nr:uncharacterized protein LOC110981443 [Acanthaster planci]